MFFDPNKLYENIFDEKLSITASASEEIVRTTHHLFRNRSSGSGGGTDHSKELGHQLRVRELGNGGYLGNARLVALEPEEEDKFARHVRSRRLHDRLAKPQFQLP